MKFKDIAICLFASTLLFACGDGVKPAPVGEACEEVEDCDSDLCVTELTSCDPFFGCSTFELTDGMCSNACTFSYEGTEEERLQSDCDEGELCLSYGFSESVCFVSCEEDEDCREDYTCQHFSTFSTCLPPEDAARVVEGELEIYANPTLGFIE